MTKIQRFQFVAFFLVLPTPLAARAATYYVSPTGSDTAAGTLDAPFASWTRAQTAAAAGDTVYFRGGTYKYTDATSTCSGTSATVDSVVLSKSGTSGNMINYWAYQGETPVFDFSGVTDTSKYNCRHVGVRIEGDYLYLKGLELTGTLQLNSDNHESWCLYVMGGSNNKFELLNAHHNMGPGFFIQEGGGNTFLNCDSHENEDSLTSNGDGQSADGFGCHPDKAGDTGNIFHGCRAWWNSDDGWDFIKSQEACTVEYSWSWYHGYKPDALSGGKPVALAAGNGNGFKGGGYDMPPNSVPAVIPQHILRFNVSFFNKAAGFYANHSPDSAYFYNDTSYSNNPDFNMLGVGSDNTSSISVGILRNNIAFGGSLTSNMNLGGGLISDENNSWDSSLGITVKEADFQSVAFAPPASCPAVYSAGGTVCVPPTDTTSFAGMASARQADGSLPVLPFLRLAAGSPEIDKGTTTGLPQPYPAYVGAAPDLGAFEYGATAGTSGGSGGAVGTGGAIGGSTGAAGSSGTGGKSSGSGGLIAGGVSGASAGSAAGGTSGGVGGSTSRVGGVTGSAGIGGTGGVAFGGRESGGALATGGALSNSGGVGTGGMSSTSGGASTGGASSGSGGYNTGNSSGGAEAGGGSAGNGGAVEAGGGGVALAGSSGSSSSALGGGPASSGPAGASGTSSGNSSGCSCHMGRGKAGGDLAATLAMLALFGTVTRRRRRRVG
ncbi:MAG: hypothetical protein WCG85_05105 [Polyangia bacterium]